MRVAIAEDNTDMREMIAEALRKDGHNVVEVGDGAALRRELDEHPLDLVISDICMPIVTGLAVLRSLRASGSPLPVVLMTAFSDASVREEAVTLGAVLFDKPFKLDALRTVVRTLLDTSVH